MQALRLLLSSNFDIDFNLGEEIGYGADGQVFDLTDFPDRVIKLSVLYDNKIVDNPTYSDIDHILSYLERTKPNTCARVYEHKYIGCGEEKAYIGTRKYILYYYVMEKLYKTTEDERKVFHSIMSHEDRGVKKNLPPNVVLDMLHGMQRGLEFDLKKVLNFYSNIRNSSIDHQDIHVRNIMKDGDGNFKLIDFDRVKIGEQNGSQTTES